MAQWAKRKQTYNDNNYDNFEVVLLGDKDGNVINAAGVASNINISLGSLEGYTSASRFGAVPAMSTGMNGSIWDINDTVYNWKDSAGIITISTTSSNGAAVTTDSGLQVLVSGLDSDYNVITETITINGSSGSSTKQFLRVNDAFIKGVTNASNINLSIGSEIVQRISIGKGRSLSTNFTVPAGYTAFLIQGTTTCSYGSDATVDMYVRPFGNGFVIGHTLEVSGAGGQYIYQFSVPIKIEQKSDIDVRASVRSNNSRVTAAYDLILVENSQL